MADKTIPALTTASLQTGYFLPFAINTSTEANKTSIDSFARFIYENYIVAQPPPYYTDSLSVNYGGYGVFGNLYASGKFHSRGTGYFDSISAGSINGNTIGSPSAHIIGGPACVIQNSPYSVILGGAGTLIKTNVNGSVFAGGGNNNIVESDSAYSAVIAGTDNHLSGNYSVCIGGSLNATNNQYCGTFGGLLNSASNLYGGIIGGNSNEIVNASASASNSVIVGANLSAISGSVSSVICGGGEQRISQSSNYSFVGGGYRNLARGTYNAILAGEDCDISGTLAAIVGSNTSIISGGTTSRSAIIGGTTNKILGAVTQAVILGGTTNSIFGSAGLIAGSNTAALGVNSNYSSAISSLSSNVSGNYSSILGGQGNGIGIADYAVVVGGSSNTVRSSCTRAALLGGTTNHIIAGTEGAIVGGTQCLLSGTQSSIIGGSVNTIGSNSSFCTILGGNNNSIYSSADRNSILGGTSNLISDATQRSSIVAGNSNTIAISTSSAVIIGSDTNSLAGSVSILAATTNSASTGINAFVLGGVRNTISGSSSTAIRGGIIGGSDNILSGFHGGIFLGDANKVLAQRAATFGGTLITIPSNHAGAYVFGDSRTIARTSKCGDSATFHFASGVTISGSNLEVERTGAFYGGVCMGTGRMVMTAISGSASISTLGISPGAYSGFAVSAPGVRTGDFVVISQNSYSGSTFGDAANTLITFNPQAFQDQIRFYMFNPSGPSSVAPNPRLDWVVFKTSPLGAI
jgi:hypothetical protein